MNKRTWKIGGEAGFGIMVSGMTFSKVLSRAGYQTVETNDYPSLVRGGHNVIAVTVSDEPIHAPYKPVDVLVALNKQTIDFHQHELSENAAIIYDGDEYEVDKTALPKSVKLYPVPLLKIAKELNAGMLLRNTVALGATLALFGIDLKLLTDILSSQFAKKGEEVVAQNVGAAKQGYDHIKKNFTNLSPMFPPLAGSKEKIVLTGAEAVGLGALAAGVNFVAIYPMTPINALLAFMASIQEKMGIVYKQPEDEIAGLNMAIGASFAGARSMVATSGGGYSLMVEATSLAGMIEAPVVIVMGMRPGPATGLPTWTGQADLHFVLNASQGEFPRLIVAPGDMDEAFYLTGEAFNLADRYQTPTFILVDKTLMENRFSNEVFDLKKVAIDRGKLLSEEEQNSAPELARYKLTDDGISPRGIPGRKGGVFRANSDEHNEMGYSEESPENTYKMITKRMKKQYLAEENVPPPVVYGPKDAEITLVGWGSTKGSAVEALKYLPNANYIQLNYINPFPTKHLTDLLKKSKRVIDIEGNHNAQMADLIRMKTGIHITTRILKFEGRPFYPEEIVDSVRKIKDGERIELITK